VLFEFRPFSAGTFAASPALSVGKHLIPLLLVRHPRAKRYVLRLRPDGSARVTIPRGGSATEARRFAEGHRAWLERQLHRQATAPHRPATWLIGTEILFRGVPTRIAPATEGESDVIHLGDERIRTEGFEDDLRPAIQTHLWNLAAQELPSRVRDLAAENNFPEPRVTVRNQRTRWGSCSRRGHLSLNWRLIQMPALVGDYIILHELCHLREMNHSQRFWREVKQVCPDFELAEQWLKRNSRLLR
jgi:predicted metal-dependent hydrolase